MPPPVGSASLWKGPSRFISAVARSDCQACFAAVDAESLVELGAYDRFSAWRLGVLLWRSLYSLYSVLGKAWRALWKAAPPQRDEAETLQLGKSMKKVY